MMDKIWGLVSIYYQLNNNYIALLCDLSNKYAFLHLNLDKVWSSINL